MAQLDSSQDHHFYASTGLGWGTGTTREAAIALALKNSGTAAAGLSVYSVRVERPQTATYNIEYFTPQGVPISLREQARYALKRGKLVKVAE